ncbi:hypothetical protein T492DRAFT_1000713 [Pavlovales sp. CCMP2436]|nr:hypothetical protein T492DRAFT_1000713 [Pavlovales sp. CCMP2436]
MAVLPNRGAGRQLGSFIARYLDNGRVLAACARGTPIHIARTRRVDAELSWRMRRRTPGTPPTCRPTSRRTLHQRGPSRRSSTRPTSRARRCRRSPWRRGCASLPRSGPRPWPRPWRPCSSRSCRRSPSRPCRVPCGSCPCKLLDRAEEVRRVLAAFLAALVNVRGWMLNQGS